MSGRRISPFNTPKTTAFAPIANASVKTATMVNPGDLRNTPKAEAHIVYKSLDEIAADGFAAFLFEPLMAAELDARAAFCLGAIQARTFKIVGAVLDV